MKNMENNSTETATKPNIGDRIRIFMQYLGQNFEDTDYNPRPFTLLGLTQGWYFEAHDPEAKPEYQLTRHHAGRCSLLVKPLSKISDEDAFEVCNIINPVQDTAPKQNNIDFGKKVVKEMWGFNRIGLDGADHQKVIDFLRSRGYALPYAKWNVEELEGFGVFKLID